MCIDIVLPISKLFVVDVAECVSVSNGSSVGFLKHLNEVQSNCAHSGYREIIIPVSSAHSVWYLKLLGPLLETKWTVYDCTLSYVAGATVSTEQQTKRNLSVVGLNLQDTVTIYPFLPYV